MQQNRDFEVSQKFFWIDVLTTDGPIKRGTLQKGAFRILASLKWTVPNPSSQVTKIWGGAIAARKVWYKYKYSQMTIQIQEGLLYSFCFANKQFPTEVLMKLPNRWFYVMKRWQTRHWSIIS